MYRNRKYRSGTSTLISRQSSHVSAASQSNADATDATEAIGHNSNALTDRANIIPEEGDYDSVAAPVSSIQKSKSNGPAKRRPVSPATIPASQIIPVSCYVSQRSILQRTQSYLSGTISQRMPLTYFERVLEKCGIILPQANGIDSAYQLNCDHLQFVMALRTELYSNSQFPENTQQFLSGLQDLMRSQTHLVRLLSGCAIRLLDGETTRPSQESLMQDLLMIDFLQSDIIELLLNRIKVIVIDEQSSQHQVELILSQLKFVDHLANGDNLFERTMDILELAGEEARNTIVRYLPDIIDISKHNVVVQKLIEILPNDEQLLTESAIDSLSNMAISSQQHSIVCQKIILYMHQKAPIQLWPKLVKFILNFNHQSSEQLASTIEELRVCLNFHKYGQRTSIAEIQTDVFHCISRSLIRSKLLFDTWLKVIQSKCERIKSIDFIILLMMMTIKDEKSTYIENIIRRKIKADVIQISLLRKMIDELPDVLLEYFTIFLEIMDVFLRAKNDSLVKFASAAFKLAFGIQNGDRKMLLMKVVGFVCEKRATSCINDSSNGDSTFDVTTNALMILMEINALHSVDMQKNCFQILRILDHVHDITLTQFRIVMDILCSLAYAEQQCDMLKDHIDILVKKQVSSSIRGVKNRGIIGVVRVIDHLVWNNGNNEEMDIDNDISFNTIEELPGVASRTAASLVEMLITSTLTCPYHLALVFDELTSIFQLRNKKYCNGKRNLNHNFLIWICDLMSVYFENHFVVDECQAQWPSLDFEFLYALNPMGDAQAANTEENVPPNVAIDVAGSVTRSSSNAIGSITVLPSLFNLLRILQYRRYFGTLEAIDAVLGAAVVLPTVMAFPHECNIFDELPVTTCEKVLDMYYHTVNFWRECVSAYVSQRDVEMRRKVLTRLSEIIRFEMRIRELLQLAPDDFDYTPPICQFSSANNNVSKHITKFKKPNVKSSMKKKKPSKSQNDTTLPPDTELNQTDLSPVGSASRANRRLATAAAITIDCDAEELHREMDPDIMLLFEENLLLKYPMTQNTIGAALGVLEFKFLMEHVIKKVESIIGITKLSNQYDISDIHPDFISDLVQILPKIMTFFKQLSNHLKVIVNYGDSSTMDIDNSSKLYTDETNYIKVCFGLCMRLLSGLYLWPAFEDDTHKDLLRDSLKAIFVEGDIAANVTIAEMALTGIECIMADSNVVLDLRSAVYMFTLVKSLVKHVDDPKAYGKYVVKLCNEFLSKQWYDQSGSDERGTQCNVQLDTLLRGYFRGTKFSFVKQHINWINDEVKGFLSNKNTAFTTFPCFTRNNFSVLFRVIYASLIETLERNIDKKTQSIGQLKVWEKSHEVITQMLEVVKILDMPRIFSLFLKYTQMYLKLFLLHGMPVVEGLLLPNVERVSTFLKALQHTTRFLHNICVHSKEIKNTTIIAQIPTIRETVEQLVYRVKGALAANKCSSVFWMGNLKNKNLHGDEILTQTSSMTRNEGGDDDDDDGVNDDDGLNDDDESSRASTNASNEANVSQDDDEAGTSSRRRSRRSRVGPNLSRSRTMRLS